MKERIESCWGKEPDLEAVQSTIEALDKGAIRVAEQIDGEWVVHDWVKKAILMYFRVSGMATYQMGPYEFYDKIPLKQNLKEQGVRLVPPGHVRYGAFLERGCVVMPGYVNIGAYVGAGTMVGTSRRPAVVEFGSTKGVIHKLR